MNIQLKDFEGPFDLLLHLVRVAKMDIYNIRVSEIIDQYLSFIESVNTDDIDTSSEYLVMSSELIHLKSKMLVNKNDSEEDNEDEYSITSEEDLKNKIIEYEKYKNMTETFRELEDKRNDYYTKLPESLNQYIENEKVVNSNVTLDDLLNAFLEMQKRIDLKKPISTRITRKEYSVKDRIIEIRNLLKNKERIEFSELFDILTRENVVVTFLSLLDMSKNKEITLKQSELFSPIVIERVEVL